VGSAEGYVGGTRERWLRRQASPKTEGAVLQRYLAGELSAPLALMHLVIAAPEPEAVEAAVARLRLSSVGAARRSAPRSCRRRSR
jgi:hypothetical protein